MALYVTDLESLRGKPLAVILADPKDWIKDSYGERVNYAPASPMGMVCEVCLSGALLIRNGIRPWRVRELDDIIGMKDTHHDEVDSYLGEKAILDRVVKEYLAEIKNDDVLPGESDNAEEFNDWPKTDHEHILEVCKRFDKEVGCAVS